MVQMNLLFDDIAVIETSGDPAAVDVRGIAYDSRRVVPGDLFCCVPGDLSDGHAFAAEAVDRGAVGLLCEHFVPSSHRGPSARSWLASPPPSTDSRPAIS